MGYSELEARIRAEYQKVEAEIKRAEAAKLEALRLENEATSRKAASKILSDAQTEGRTLKLRLIGKARLAAMKRVASEKNLMVDDVFAKSLEALHSSSDKEKSRIMLRLAKDADAIQGRKRILVEAEHIKLLGEVSDTTIVGSAIGGFGLVIESEDRTRTIDNRLQEVLKRSQEQLRPEVSRILFG